MGQLLRYRFLLAQSTGRKARLVLATERPPKDHSWVGLCAEVGILLVWPKTFSDLGSGQAKQA